MKVVLAEYLGKIESAGGTGKTVDGDTSGSCRGVSLGDTLNQVSPCDFDEGFPFVRYWPFTLVSCQRATRDRRNSVRDAYVLPNFELWTLNEGIFGLEDHVTTLVEQGTGKSLKLVIPIAGFTIERMSYVESPKLGQ